MKTKKIFVSIILCFSIILCDLSHVRANVGTGILALVDLAGKVINGDVSGLVDFINQTFINSGFLAPSIDYQTLEDYVHENYPELEGENENETKENVNDYLGSNISITDDSVTFNNNSKEFFINLANYYIDSKNPHIFYACGLQESLNSLNATIVADMAQIIEDNPNSYFILINTSPNIFFIVFKENGNKIYGVLNHTYNASWSDFRLYQAVSSNGIVTTQSFTANSPDDMVAYIYDGNTQHLNPYTVTYPWNDNAANHGYFNVLPLQDAAGSDWNRYPKAFNTVSQSIQTFNSVNELNDYISTYGIGKNPYYTNNNTWNNFTSSTGDYTVDNSNVNTVTYGDVISYVNDYHDTNNNYPDNSTVNTWIETTNNNNNSGGGSGDDSGGGSGGSGGDSGGSGIVSILTALGKAIADLITGIAAFLAEVVGGLVEAITGLLDTLTDLITNFTESIPNIFSPLLGWLFDGLPEEFTAIILLGLTACVIASIIKILRG